MPSIDLDKTWKYLKLMYKEITTDKSAFFLFASNILVLALFLIDNVSIFALLAVYIYQTAILLLFGFLKFILSIHNIADDKQRSKALITGIISFIAVAIIMIIYGVFGTVLGLLLHFYYVLFATIVFFLVHSYSFFVNIENDTKKILPEEKYLLRPAYRIQPILYTFLFISLYLFIGNFYTILIFGLVKTFIDLSCHIKEHEFEKKDLMAKD